MRGQIATPFARSRRILTAQQGSAGHAPQPPGPAPLAAHLTARVPRRLLKLDLRQVAKRDQRDDAEQRSGCLQMREGRMRGSEILRPLHRRWPGCRCRSPPPPLAVPRPLMTASLAFPSAPQWARSKATSTPGLPGAAFWQGCQGDSERRRRQTPLDARAMRLWGSGVQIKKRSAARGPGSAARRRCCLMPASTTRFLRQSRDRPFRKEPSWARLSLLCRPLPSLVSSRHSKPSASWHSPTRTSCLPCFETAQRADSQANFVPKKLHRRL